MVVFEPVELSATPAELVQARALVLFSGVLSAEAPTRQWVEEVQSATDELLRHSVIDDPEEELLVFSLLALYQLLQLESVLAFSVFRRALYQGSLNEELAVLGGRIHVYESVGSIDENLYALVRL